MAIRMSNNRSQRTRDCALLEFHVSGAGPLLRSVRTCSSACLYANDTQSNPELLSHLGLRVAWRRKCLWAGYDHDRLRRFACSGLDQSIAQ